MKKKRKGKCIGRVSLFRQDTIQFTKVFYLPLAFHGKPSLQWLLTFTKQNLVHNLCKLSPHKIFSIALLYGGMLHGLEIEKLRFKEFEQYAEV